MSDRAAIPHPEAASQQAVLNVMKDLLDAQQDTNSLLRDLISEIKTLRSVTEDRH